MVLVLAGCTPAPGVQEGPRAGNSTQGYVTAAGRGLEVEGEPVQLKAVNFTNRFDLDIKTADLLTSAHHTEQDFVRVRELGFNSVRFVMRGDWHDEDPKIFWEWLDRNVSWAREHGVWLILDLHIPLGGNWLDPGSNDTDFSVWSNPEVRNQNVELWREIATRYRNEPAIGAYDLMNEPVTTDSTGRQWQSLAQQLTDTIRSVGDQHLIIAGGVYGVDGQFDPEGQERHFLIDDENVMYDFHFYEPYSFTHQYASWVDPDRDGGHYPDPDHLVATSDPSSLPEESITTPPLPEGTSGWRPYDSGRVTIESPSAAAAMPQFIVEGGMTGKVQFDRVVVTEYGPDGTELRQVLEDQLTSSSTSSWYSWGDRNGTDPSAQLIREGSGHQDEASLSIGGTVESGAGWNNSEHLFKVVPGHQYRVQGYMRGEDVALTDDHSRIALELAVYGEDPNAPGGGFFGRDKEYLAYVMDQHLQFGAQHNVPMSIMEFGAVRHTFERNNKGGDRWVADMLALLKEKDLSFAYWEYHDPEMGIYVHKSGQPSQSNSPLEEVLRRELREDGS
ncbi:glycoside hydrolase family 5 protein [Kocuria rosea]|uniref:glycoside hydrolase family 5 protein n=1 Tax=Kocuria rosea TaxID=1275 RepID=UPI00203D4453|nr:cellulase family glycosylhydrolase [Kocuria rosea]MCM3687838.1 glycoside hydrolase family 5 protein [Kocuria rosea]